MLCFGKKYLSLAFALLCASFWQAAPLRAQHSGNANYANTGARAAPRRMAAPVFVNDSTLQVEVKLLMNVPANAYRAVFCVVQTGDALDQAQAMLQQRLRGFTDGLRRLGLAPAHIYLDMVSQVPVYAYESDNRLFSRTYNEVPKGFELKQNVHIRYTADTLLAAIVREAAQHEIYDLAKVDYLLDRQDEVIDSLRRTALRMVQGKLNDFKQLGAKLNAKYQTMAEQHALVQPADLYQSYTAYNSAPAQPASKRATAAEKNSSLYYNGLDTGEYDKVINPWPLAPTLQASYHLQVRYLLKRE